MGPIGECTLFNVGIESSTWLFWGAADSGRSQPTVHLYSNFETEKQNFNPSVVHRGAAPLREGKRVG